MRSLARAVRVSSTACLVYAAGCGDGTSEPQPARVASVTVSPPTATMQVGGTAQLSATPRAADGTALTAAVTWTSSNTAVVTVSATGLLMGVSPGGPVVITAAADGQSGIATVTVTPAPVATVTVTPSSPAISIGGVVQLTATTRDLGGAVLSGRVVTWTSNNAAVASVSQAGLVTGLSAGPAVITATSEGKSATATVGVVNAIATGIRNVETFLDRCPTLDAAYAQIRQDFELRSDGALVTATVACTEPFSTQPIAQLTDELIALQVLRTAYYMSQGTTGMLPWTPKSLYDWMKTNIAGVNLKTAPGQLYCCDVINGKSYFSTSRQDATQRDFKRVWTGISNSLDFYAHEIRHADAGSPLHVTGCPAFPTGVFGCDATYDLANLGAYGIQYWLNANWASGYLNIGIACTAAAKAMEYANWHTSSANSTRARFVSNAPPVVTVSAPFGGICLSG